MLIAGCLAVVFPQESDDYFVVIFRIWEWPIWEWTGFIQLHETPKCKILDFAGWNPNAFMLNIDEIQVKLDLIIINFLI